MRAYCKCNRITKSAFETSEGTKREQLLHDCICRVIEPFQKDQKLEFESIVLTVEK